MSRGLTSYVRFLDGTSKIIDIDETKCVSLIAVDMMTLHIYTGKGINQRYL